MVGLSTLGLVDFQRSIFRAKTKTTTFFSYEQTAHPNTRNTTNYLIAHGDSFPSTIYEYDAWINVSHQQTSLSRILCLIRPIVEKKENLQFIASFRRWLNFIIMK